MASIDADYVKANRIMPYSDLSYYYIGGQEITDTSDGPGYGIQGGGIVQVCWGRFDSVITWSITSSGTTVGNFFQVQISPRRSTNKMLVYTQWSGEFNSTHNMTFGITRQVGSNSTTIGPTSGDGNRNSGIAPPYMSYAAAAANSVSTPEAAVYWTLDQPNTTSTIQYFPWVKTDTNRTMYINSTVTDGNSNQYERMICTMMVWEVSF